jgi:hypothetical protein
MASAESPVFSIFEILEQILLHCVMSKDERTIGAKHQQKTGLRDPGKGIAFLLVSGCRVNKWWHETITNSSPLQQAMFLKRKTVPAGLLLNPLIGRIARTVTSVQEDDKAPKTWRKMLVVQTSESEVVLQGTHFSGRGNSLTQEVTFKGDVRMNVFATWIAEPAFSISCQKVDGHKAPVMVLKQVTCMKRGDGALSNLTSIRLDGCYCV